MHEAVDAEGYEGQDEEEDDDYDGDYVVLLDHFGGGRPRESRFAEWRFVGGIFEGVPRVEVERARARSRRRFGSVQAER